MRMKHWRVWQFSYDNQNLFLILIMNTYIWHTIKLGTYFWNIITNEKVLIIRGWKTATFSIVNETLASQRMFNMFPVHIDTHFGTFSYRSASSNIPNIFLTSWQQFSIRWINWLNQIIGLLYAMPSCTLFFFIFHVEEIRTNARPLLGKTAW